MSWRRWLALGLVLAATRVVAQVEAPAPHAFLQRLCDDFGGRMTGTAANRAAMERLAAELRALGYAPEFDRFTMPGWERGDDRVELLAPLRRPLRVASLSYTQPHAPFEAEVVFIGNGRTEDFPRESVAGRIGLLAASSPQQMRDLAAEASSRGLRGVLFINREGGGQLLARTGSFSGAPLSLPVYSIAQEEGLWLQRLLGRGERLRVRMETRSRCVPAETANLVLRIPGAAPSMLIVGAHFDSWDLGQGAMDNGLGIAQLFGLAQTLRGKTLHHTIELVWFNGEEQGLFGSRHAAAKLGDRPIVAMINLDMVGAPIAVNALGDASLLPALTRWHEGRPAERRLAKGVENLNWAASDHTPYQLAGVRAITFNAPIPRESVRYYHDLADTIDKVPAALLDGGIEIISDVVLTLAQDTTLAPARRTPAETKQVFTGFGLERRMRGIGLWPFDEVAADAPAAPGAIRRALAWPATAATTESAVWQAPGVSVLVSGGSMMNGDRFADSVLEPMRTHFAGRRNLVLVLHASHHADRDRMEARLQKAFAHLGVPRATSLHRYGESEALAAIEAADAIFVGGGETFVLLRELTRTGQLEAIRRRVLAGVPYGGASAGANVAGLIIGTTNDFPVADVPGRAALRLLPVTINPHHPTPETRADFDARVGKIRIYQQFNPAETVLALANASMVRLHNGEARLVAGRGWIYPPAKPPRELTLNEAAPELVAKLPQ